MQGQEPFRLASFTIRPPFGRADGKASGILLSSWKDSKHLLPSSG
ncbi:MAG: hypothetical protein ACTHMM_18210 [Agriterribacter sp.]